MCVCVIWTWMCACYVIVASSEYGMAMLHCCMLVFLSLQLSLCP